MSGRSMNESDATGSKAWRAVAALFLVSVVWSINGPLIKLLYADGAGLSGMTITFYRSLIGGLAFLPWALRERNSLRLAPARVWLASVASFTVMTATFIVATTFTAAASAIVLQYTAPVWVVVLSPFFLGERARRSEAMVLVVAMLGVAVVFLGNPVLERTALAIALTSGLAFACVQMTLRALRAAHPVMLMCMNALGSAAALAPVVALSSGFAVTAAQWPLLLALSIVQFCIPYLVYSWAVRHVAAYRAALIVLLEAVLNPLWTYLVVGERVPFATVVGGCLIVGSVAGWVVLGWRPRQPQGRQAP